jgi:hypothetical protein
VFENRVLRRIFGPNRDGVTGGWRKLHNEELHYLYSSSNIIRIIKSRRMRWAEHVARKGEKKNVYRLLVGKPQGRRSLGRPRPRWIDNIKMGFVEIRLVDVDWIGPYQDRYRSRALVNAVLCYIIWRCVDSLLQLKSPHKRLSRPQNRSYPYSNPDLPAPTTSLY